VSFSDFGGQGGKDSDDDEMPGLEDEEAEKAKSN
jgi:hypothetical protein